LIWRICSMKTGKFTFSFILIFACFSLSGCSASDIDPFLHSWWIIGGLVLAILGGTTAGFLDIRRLRTRLNRMNADLEERSTQVEQKRKELEALYQADDELNRYLHLDDVLQSLVNISVELMHADKGSLLVWDDQKERLIARATRGFLPETVAIMSFAKGQGLAGKVALSGEPAIVEDAQLDERVTHTVIKAEKIRGLIQIPIRVAGEVFGIFSADYLEPHCFTEEEKRLLSAFAQRAGTAIEKARLYEREEQIALMQERNRLARDLHDSVTQSLYGVSLYAEVVTQLLKSGDLEKTTTNLQELKGLALDALAEMRMMIYELRPSAFEEEGLVAAIQTRLDSVEGRVGLNTKINVEGKISLSHKIEEGLYRIAQEALNNVLKHAHAHTITVNLVQDESLVTLEIVDDGVGFDPAQACDSGCLGLKVMEERSQEMNAKLEIISREGKGTRIIVRRSLP
jgi:signal transduction histidine kinase